MRTTILFLIAILFSWNVEAQLRFKKVYPEAMGLAKQEAYDLFLEFQRENPQHAVNYYQLGQISMDWMFQYDPLTRYKDVQNLCYNAKLYFGLARHNITEKDVRKSHEYLHTIEPAFGEKLLFVDVTNYLDSVYALAELYAEKTTEAKEYFDKSIDFYNLSVARYRNINNRIARIKDLYLTADQTLLDEARALKTSYDSAMHYFYNYKNVVSNYDRIKYNQTLDIRPITTYRLEGLSQQNFLKPKVLVYNYGAWVDSLFSTLNGEVADFRKAIEDADFKFDLAMNHLRQPKAKVKKKDDYFRLDNALRYKIGKFDNNALMVDWFEFRDGQVDLFIKSKNELINTNDTAHFLFVRRAKFFESIVKAKQKADSTLMVFRQNITQAKVAKYPVTFGKKYGGISGLRHHASKNGTLNDSLMAENFSALQDFFNRENQQFYGAGKVFKFKRTSIPYKDTLSLGELSNNTFKTMHVMPAPSGGYYVAGLHKVRTNLIKPFVGFTKDSIKLDWFRKPNIKGIRIADQVIIQPLDKGCAVMVHGKLTANKPSINTVVRLDEFGNEHTKTILQTGDFPQAMLYDDINEKILTVFKGTSPTNAESEPLRVYLNGLDGTPYWSKDIAIQGAVASVQKMEQEFIVFANFTSVANETAPIVSQAQGTNACAIFIGEDGVQHRFETYHAPFAYSLLKVYKLNSNTINLIGYKNTTDKTGFVYILTDEKGKVKFKKL